MKPSTADPLPETNAEWLKLILFGIVVIGIVNLYLTLANETPLNW
jgi:hypothetical protein